MINLPRWQRITVIYLGFRAEKKLEAVKYIKKFADIPLGLICAYLIFIGQKAEKLVKAAILLQGFPEKSSAGIENCHLRLFSAR